MMSFPDTQPFLNFRKNSCILSLKNTHRTSVLSLLGSKHSILWLLLWFWSGFTAIMKWVRSLAFSTFCNLSWWSHGWAATTVDIGQQAGIPVYFACLPRQAQTSAYPLFPFKWEFSLLLTPDSFYILPALSWLWLVFLNSTIFSFMVKNISSSNSQDIFCLKLHDHVIPIHKEARRLILFSLKGQSFFISLQFSSLECMPI